MFKIAWSGMKGRKKETLINVLIIILSITFIIVSTILFSSVENTHKQNLMTTYGTWREIGKISKASLLENRSTTLSSDVGILEVLGKSSKLGVVGSYNDAFMTQSHIKMIEGRMPESKNEMVMTYSQSSKFAKGIALGDEVSVEIEIPVTKHAEEALDEMNLQSLNGLYGDYFKSFLDETQMLFPSSFSKGFSSLLDPRQMEYESFTELLSKYPYFYNSIHLNPKLYSMSNEDLSIFLSLYDSGAYERLMKDHLYKSLLSSSSNVFTSSTYELKNRPDFKFYLKQSQQGIQFEPYVKSEKVSMPLSMTDFRGLSPYSEKTIIVNVPLKVVGFMDDYTEKWTVGKMKLPNTFISPELYKSIHEEIYTLDGINSMYFNLDRYVVTEDPLGIREKEKFIYSSVEKNSGYYNKGNQEGSKEDRLLMLSIVSLIFVTTSMALFQINLFQVRKRVRRFGLLKAIGATRTQLRKLLLDEVWIYMSIGLIFGLSFGFLFSYILIKVLNHYYKMDLLYYARIDWIFLGVILSFLAVILGMSYSYFRAIRAPFNAQMAEVPRHKKVLKRIKCYEKGKLLNFRNISIHQAKIHYKKNLLSFFLCSVVITALLSAVVLSYVVYTPYVDDVIIPNVPDYSIEIPHGMKSRDFNGFKDDLLAIEGVSEVESYRSGKETYISYKTLFDSAPFNAKDEKVHEKYKNFKYTGIMANTKKVEAYGIDPNGQLFMHLKEKVLDPSFDVARFELGKAGILILPRYSENEFSLNFKYQYLYDESYNVSESKNFVLIAPAEGFITRPDGSFEYLEGKAVAKRYNVQGVVHGFEDIGFWPFTELKSNPIVLLSDNGFKKLYVRNGFTLKLSFDEIADLSKVFYPSGLGRILYTINVDPDVDLYKIESQLRTLAGKWEVKPYNHMVDKNYHKHKVFKLIIVLLVFGIAVSSIAMMIIFNIIMIKVENERERIGILQAIGVKASQFKRVYRNTGIAFGVFSLIVAIVVTWVILLFTVGPMNDILKSKGGLLYNFPWALMFFIGVFYVYICARVHYKPIKNVIENQPIYNIQVNQN